MRLAYLEIEASDLEAWGRFAQTILCAEIVAATPEDILLLRIDERIFRIALRKGPADDVVTLGFELDHREALVRVGDALRAADCEVRSCPPEVAASRGAVELLSTVDPTGLTIEFSYGGLARPQAPFAPPGGHSGFVTGDQGLGHVMLSVPDVELAQRFYQGVLGFRITDYIATNYNGRDARFVFMRANARHHTLAVGHLPVGKRLLHFMLQCRDLDDVGRALDRVSVSGLRQTRSLGRHVNDKMVSFYMETPSKIQVEYGFGGVEVKEESSWPVTTYDVTSIWGHRHL
ncbi:MAG: glyoxalase [Hyphomicrobiales bacterium]|nr:MAG: glyoxalase [Hyphomicrobiales bacterium]